MCGGVEMIRRELTTGEVCSTSTDVENYRSNGSTYTSLVNHMMI